MTQTWTTLGQKVPGTSSHLCLWPVVVVQSALLASEPLRAQVDRLCITTLSASVQHSQPAREMCHHVLWVKCQEVYRTLNIFIKLAYSFPKLDLKVSKGRGTWLTRSFFFLCLLDVYSLSGAQSWVPDDPRPVPQTLRFLHSFHIHPLKLDAVPDLHCLLLYQQCLTADPWNFSIRR